jgi:hypothetical protein
MSSQPPGPVEPSLTITEFCKVEKISRSAYYGMKRLGLGPDEMYIGDLPRITPESHRRWRRQRTVRSPRGRPAKSITTINQEDAPV